MTGDGRVRVLFICVGNSCRSQMAEGFARSLAGARIVSSSAGSRPEGFVNPAAIRLMAEKGIDLTGHRSKGLADLPDGAAWDYVVTMGCGDACPGLRAGRRLDWNIPDPWGLDDGPFRAVRDRIEAEVRRLIEEIEGATGTPEHGG